MLQDILRRLMRQGLGRQGLGRVRNPRTLLLIVLVLAAVLKLIPTDDDEQRHHRSSEPVPDRIEGRPRLKDGDSFQLGRHEVRMVGIDAPEGRQMCQLNGKPWACGTESMRRLQAQIRGGQFSCKSEERDKYNRILATCFVDGRNINQWMVENGWAVAFGRRYQGEERTAKAERRGLWKSVFKRPRRWRDENNNK